MINRTEQEIMKNWKGDIDKPAVSVCSVTYDHEKYIAEAIDSFLMQQTDFPFEVLINDDCSTDNTANIIRGYEKEYPNIIKPIYQKENQYSQGIKVNAKFNLSRAKGKYIALCEGDDYWTDPLKLQKQVDFLDSHKEYNMVFHNAELQHHTENGVTIKPFNPEEKSRDYTADEILRTWSVATASVLCCNEGQYRYLEDNAWFPVSDTPYFIKCASLGKLYYMAEQMSVYRRVPTGLMNSAKFKSVENNLVFIEYFKSLHNDFGNLLTKKTIDLESARHYVSAANKCKNIGSTEDYSKYMHHAVLCDPEVVFEQVIQPNNKEIKSLKDRVRLQDKAVHDLQEELKRTKSYLHIIFDKIHQTISTSGKTEPIKKYKAYKEMLKTYYEIKNKFKR